jgi:DNA-nicking Smr family endonuclease
MKETPHKETSQRSRLRRLSDEEINLWLTVTKSVTPRKEAVLPTPARPPAPPVPEMASPAIPPAAQLAVPPAGRGTLLPRLAPIERKLRQRLSRGQAEVDAVIDLHGLTQQEAYSALHRFLHRAQGGGARLVLVVTGKGSSDDYGGTGVLRRSVPHWLRAPDWRSLIVGFEEASRPHGGAGALYVRLRRRDRPDR